MTNSYQDDIISSLASLLIEPNYSDMTLKCDGREIKVHQCIVCLRSPVLAAAVSGDFEVNLFFYLYIEAGYANSRQGSEKQNC